MELRKTDTEGKFEIVYDHDTAVVRLFPEGVADNFEEVRAGDKRIFHCKQQCYVEYVTIAGVLCEEVQGNIFPGTDLIVNLQLFLTHA